MNRFRQWIVNFMRGRYGIDELYQFLTLVLIILMLLFSFTRLLIFNILELIVFFYTLFRVFSRNYVARRKENDKYLALTARIRKWFNLQKKKWNDRKDYRYRSCPAWRDKFIEGFLPDILGFACIPTFAVVLAPGDGWMDIAVIPDAKDRLNAKYMLVVLCRHLLVNRHKYATIQEAVEEILRICEDFLGKL